MPATPSLDAATAAAARRRAADEATLPEPCVLLKLGEIVLKGRNRQQFERLLHTNIRDAARDLGFGIRLWQRDGVILLRVTGERVALDRDVAALTERMLDIPGIVRVSHAQRVAKDPEA